MTTIKGTYARTALEAALAAITVLVGEKARSTPWLPRTGASMNRMQAMMSITVYKLCRYHNERRTFESLSSRSPVQTVSYVLGLTTKPRIDGSLLFAYDTLERATDALKKTKKTVVLECGAIVSAHHPPRVLGPLYEEETVRFWDDWNMRGRLSRWAKEPVQPGTVLCESITPVAEHGDKEVVSR